MWLLILKFFQGEKWCWAYWASQSNTPRCVINNTGIVSEQLQSHLRNWKIIRNLGSDFFRSLFKSSIPPSSSSRRLNRQLSGKPALPEQRNYYNKSRVICMGTEQYFISVILCYWLPHPVPLNISQSLVYMSEGAIRWFWLWAEYLSLIFLQEASCYLPACQAPLCTEECRVCQRLI